MNMFSYIWERGILPLLEPWKIIRTRRFHFVAWVVGLPILGLAGFWLPLVLTGAMKLSIKPVFEQLLYGGTLVAFSVTILAEGCFGLLTAEKAGSNPNALAIRGLAGIFTIVLIVMCAGIMACEVTVSAINNISIGVPASPGNHVAIPVHIIFSLLAMLTASYLYCFRFPAWEKGVADAQQEEDNEVSKLSEMAARQAAAGEVKL